MQESTESRETDVIVCACGQQARRVIAAGHLPGLNGFTAKPTREHYINLNRAMEAQHELVDSCERAHIEPPDCLAIAKARIKRGDAVAIEG